MHPPSLPFRTGKRRGTQKNAVRPDHTSTNEKAIFNTCAEALQIIDSLTHLVSFTKITIVLYFSWWRPKIHETQRSQPTTCSVLFSVLLYSILATALRRLFKRPWPIRFSNWTDLEFAAGHDVSRPALLRDDCWSNRISKGFALVIPFGINHIRILFNGWWICVSVSSYTLYGPLL